MDPTMAQALGRIEAAHARLGRDTLLRALRPGLGAPDLDRSLTDAGLPDDAFVRSLFRWHDGVDTDGAVLGDLWLFPGFYPLSLEDALLHAEAFRSHPRWGAGWLPVFADGGGDFYVVDRGDGREGAVRRFRMDEWDQPVEFANLADMVRTVATAFDDGIYHVDDEGWLEVDDAAFAGLARRLNPGVRHWAEP
ncbi:SMI1/KNR4 family protein [Ornithinimicrobium kibberense]|uniref:SMI1/KNR4 family protein n=1 Tax=Ornithinimicrobium kibberense TaxID=282060 RepID=A0ABV5UZC8_9MICO|nr:SMI1/KNR4 family protein [Ornithinimicrobium kibberense]